MTFNNITDIETLLKTAILSEQAPVKTVDDYLTIAKDAQVQMIKLDMLPKQEISDLVHTLYTALYDCAIDLKNLSGEN